MANTFDLQTKIERAIYALITANGLGDVTNTFPGEAAPDVDRPLPNTGIDAGGGDEIDFSGVFRFSRGEIVFHDPAIVDQAQPNRRSAFAAAQVRTSGIIALLEQSTDQTTMDYTRQLLNAAGRALAVDPSNGANQVQATAAANNQDMTDFTLQYWRISDYGVVREVRNDQGPLYYERIVGFECLACNSNTD